MVNLAALTPFSTAARYAANLPAFLAGNEYDGQRVAAYQVWEDVYWGQLNLLQTEASGDDPIQVPVLRAVVEATVRYLAVGWDLYFDPRVGTPEGRLAAEDAFRALFRREDVWGKFQAQKRWGLVRGDAVWHVTADPGKSAGTRLSIHAVDPATYFPTLDPAAPGRVLAAHLVEPVEIDGDFVARRQTYRRLVDGDGRPTGEVTSELALFELADWDDRDGQTTKLLRILRPVEVLPGVRHLPVYRVPNTVAPGDDYGSSLLRGLERLAKGVDQTVTDEDLAVALAGLGFYTTDSTGPVDDAGQATGTWDLSPLNVQQLGKNAAGAPATFRRVDGVGSVEPSQTHAAYLTDAAGRGASVPSVALGSVDAATAESGIALFLRLSPLLSANREREDVMLGVVDQMLYDLQHDWFPAFEDVDLSGVVVSSSVEDPMPVDRASKVREVLDLSQGTPPLITVEEARGELAKLGYQFPDGLSADRVLRQVGRLAAEVDPYAGRLAAEVEDDPAAGGTE